MNVLVACDHCLIIFSESEQHGRDAEQHQANRTLGMGVEYDYMFPGD